MKKYYTAFVVEGHDPVSSLHVTHAYFGRLPKVTADDLQRDLAAYFQQKPFVPFTADFDKPGRFGPMGDICVLEGEVTPELRPDLRELLTDWILGDYPTYRPHITIGPGSGPLNVRIVDYVLIENKQVIWSASK